MYILRVCLIGAQIVFQLLLLPHENSFSYVTIKQTAANWAPDLYITSNNRQKDSEWDDGKEGGVTPRVGVDYAVVLWCSRQDEHGS